VAKDTIKSNDIDPLTQQKQLFYSAVSSIKPTIKNIGKYLSCNGAIGTSLYFYIDSNIKKQYNRSFPFSSSWLEI
jgi:hypothetical protein